MNYEQIEGSLSLDARTAIAILEREGFEILLSTKIEDTFRKGGDRRRTFNLRGRYDLVLALKDLPQSEKAGDAPLDTPPDLAVEPVTADLKVEADVEKKPEEKEPGSFSESWWEDYANWRMMNREAFKEMIYEKLDELRDSSDATQGEVYKKFTRFFESEEWPL